MGNSIYSQDYDPLVANGILIAPVDRIIKENLPVKFDVCQNYPLNSQTPKDVFVPQEKKSNWKAWALGALVTVLACAGLKKCGINPFKKLTDKPFFQNITKKVNSVVETSTNFVKTHLPKKLSK